MDLLRLPDAEATVKQFVVAMSSIAMLSAEEQSSIKVEIGHLNKCTHPMSETVSDEDLTSSKEALTNTTAQSRRHYRQSTC